MYASSPYWLQPWEKVLERNDGYAFKQRSLLNLIRLK